METVVEALVGGDSKEEGVGEGSGQADSIRRVVLEHFGDEIKHVQGVLTFLFTVTLK